MSQNKPYKTPEDKPQALNETVSRTMSRIRGKDTKPEMLIRKALWAEGLKGYRLHWKQAPGKPDISYPGRKIGIFIHGCYWHRCPNCQLPYPKHNAAFWKKKFDRNTERDQENLSALKAIGWKTLVLWECEINKDIDHCMDQIRILIAQ